MNTDLESLKYPIGEFTKPAAITKELLAEQIAEIRNFPARLRKEVSALSDAQLDTPYRPEGWTVRQVVNHCADSHMNAFMRIKFILTGDNPPPSIVGSPQNLWTTLPDSKSSIVPALQILEGLHERWAILLANLSDQELEKSFRRYSPERDVSVAESAGLYAWHSNHHLAHITSLKKREGWK